MWGISPVSATYAAAFTLGALLDRGDLAEAAASLEAARELPWIGEGGRLLREGAARLLLEEDRPADALDQLTAPVDYPEVVNPAWAPWRGLKARALAGLGRSGEALELADEEVALLRRWGAPSALGPALRLRGELRGPSGTEDLREAVAVLSETRALVETARARLSLGASPEVGADEAVVLLRSALDLARACGARGVARDAVSALARRGQPADDPQHAPLRLTSRQRRVTALAASGLDVNEVAQRLFLTPGTVRAVLESSQDGDP
jgi:DNA-binding CsgD family transcriptional regulator